MNYEEKKEWEMLPIDIADETGEKFEESVKKSFHEAIDEMEPQIWHPLYHVLNVTFHDMLKKATINLLARIEDGEILIDWYPDQDFEFEYDVSVKLSDLIIESLHSREEKIESLEKIIKKLKGNK